MISTPSMRQVLVSALAIHLAAGLQPPGASDGGSLSDPIGGQDGGSGAGQGGVQPVSGDMDQDEQDDHMGKFWPTVSRAIYNESGI